MEKTRSVMQAMDGKMFFPARVVIFLLYFLLLEYFSLLCTFTWRVSDFVSRQGKGINKRNESTEKEILYITLIIS